MSAYLFDIPAGVPGTVVDNVNTVVESIEYDADLMPTAYGAPVKLVGGHVAAIESGDAATDFYGILARSNPGSSGDPSFNGYGAGVPQATQIASVAVGGPGYILVKCTIGIPVKGGIVYMRVTEDLPALVGDLEATADGVANVALTGVTWAANGKDTDGTAVIRVG